MLINQSIETFPQISLTLNNQNGIDKETPRSHLDLSLDTNHISDPSVNEAVSEHFVVVMAPPTNNNELLLQSHSAGEKFEKIEDDCDRENDHIMLVQSEEVGENFSLNSSMLTNGNDKISTELMLQNSEDLMAEQNSDIFLQEWC